MGSIENFSDFSTFSTLYKKKAKNISFCKKNHKVTKEDEEDSCIKTTFYPYLIESYISKHTYLKGN